MNVRVLLLLACLIAASAGAARGQSGEPVKRPNDSLLPKSKESWQERAADQARILSQVRWTPVADGMPNRQGGFFEKGREYTGVPYSSVRSVGRYIGFDISLRTFLAAVENPGSVLYTENLRGKVPNAAAFYGTVCSAFTSYALQCGIWEVSRRHGPEISRGVMRVEPQSAQTV